MILDRNDIVVMIGDSVTDCGRIYESQPGGWGSFGDGYVSYVDGFLNTLHPDKRIMIANKGINGNTVLDLAKRWDKDVLSLKPTWVTVMIGVNDVWRQFDGQLMNIETVDIDLFRKTYEELIIETKPYVKGMLLISPIMIEANDNHPMKNMLIKYANVAKELAIKYDLIYVDVQNKIDSFLSELNEFILCSDRVHPNNKGHAIIAKAILDAFEVEWNK